MALRTGDKPIESKIADRQVELLQADATLDEPEIHIARPHDIQRELESMEVGHIYIDMVAAGVTQVKQNRKSDRYEYETHLVVRGRPDQSIDNAFIDQVSWYRDYAQRVFDTGTGNSRLVLPGETQRAHRLQSEPFVLYGRKKLFEGLFLAPVRFTWVMLR